MRDAGAMRHRVVVVMPRYSSNRVRDRDRHRDRDRDRDRRQGTMPRHVPLLEANHGHAATEASPAVVDSVPPPEAGRKNSAASRLHGYVPNRQPLPWESTDRPPRPPPAATRRVHMVADRAPPREQRTPAIISAPPAATGTPPTATATPPTAADGLPQDCEDPG